MTRRRLAAAAALLLLVAVGLAGFLAIDRGRPSQAPSVVCAGASRCPYRTVTILGRRGEGVLRDPEAVAIGPDGSIYVGDQFSYVVQRFSAAGRFESEWGSYGRRPGQLGAVSGLAVDGTGNVYVVDATHDRIEKFDGLGHLLTTWGKRGRGVGKFSFGSGAGPDSPPGGGIAVRGSHVYVADTRNNRIEQFALDGSGARVLSKLRAVRSPRGIALTARAIYLTDEGGRQIFKFTLGGRLVARAGHYGRGPGQFGDPFGVALDRRGDVFVADNNNNRIVRLDRHLRFAAAWRGSGSGRLSYLRALAADAAGHVYVADTADDRIEEFDRSGHALLKWGLSGPASGRLVGPSGVAVSPRGVVLVGMPFGSRSPIYRFGEDLSYRATWSRGGEKALGHHFFSPGGLAFGPDGSVWVADRGNGLVRHLSGRGAFLGVVGKPGHRPGELSRPAGIAVDGRGRVYVADTANNRVERFAGDGRLLGAFGRGPGLHLGKPLAVAVDRSGHIYVTDTHHARIVKLASNGQVLGTFGRYGRAAGEFRGPDGIAVDRRGRVFVADRYNDRIEEFTGSGAFVRAWGASGVGAGEFKRPGGLAIDCQGNLLVADTFNNRIQKFGPVAAREFCGR